MAGELCSMASTRQHAEYAEYAEYANTFAPCISNFEMHDLPVRARKSMNLQQLHHVFIVTAVLSASMVVLVPFLARRGRKPVEPVIRRKERILTFSGYQWLVEETAPDASGVSTFSSHDKASVWIDYVGHLHLKCRREGRIWRTAEISCLESFGHGRYELRVEIPTKRISPFCVFRAFTYDVLSEHSHREIDIQLGGNAEQGRTSNARYGISPVDDAGHRFRFRQPDMEHTTHSFEWTPKAVWFQSFVGHRSFVDSPDQVIAFYGFEGEGIPPAGNERMHLKLDFGAQQPPANLQEIEFIVSGFSFTPMN